MSKAEGVDYDYQSGIQVKAEYGHSTLHIGGGFIVSFPPSLTLDWHMGVTVVDDWNDALDLD